MSQKSCLIDSLQRAISHRAGQGMTVFSCDQPLPSHAPDFLSNDYLSLSTDPSMKEIFLRRVFSADSDRLFGSTGSRLGTGNSTGFNALEDAFKKLFQVPSALLLPSGFGANLVLMATVPQKHDVVIYDELVHVSIREGIRLSSCPSYRFSHNSTTSFEECLRGVLQHHHQITQGSSTVFVVVESLYSMDGDFCPLTEIVGIVESLVPAGHAHIVVDEAHTSGMYGPNGTGYVSHLGLNDRVHTQVHTFGKAWGFYGAVVLTAQVIRHYLINFAKSVMFSTSTPYTDVYALEASLGVVSGAKGEELRRSLHRMSLYAHQKLAASLGRVPEAILALDSDTSDRHGGALCSPVIPVFTPRAADLAGYLLERGYGVTAMTYPVVKRPRIRVIIHARNTEEVNAFVDALVVWAGRQVRGLPPAGARGAGGRAEVEEPYVVAKL